jgi:hypothetical protein
MHMILLETGKRGDGRNFQSEIGFYPLVNVGE